MKKVLLFIFSICVMVNMALPVAYTSVSDECPYIRLSGTTLQDILVHKSNIKIEKANGYVAVSFIGGDWQTITWSSGQARSYGYSLDSLYDYILDIAKTTCDSTGTGTVTFTFDKNTGKDSIVAVLNGLRVAVKDSVGVTPTLSFAKNTAKDSIVLTYNGSRTAVKDSSITTPTLTLAKNTTRDSVVITYNGTRSAIKDSSITKPTFDFTRNASRDSFVTTYDGVRTAVKDSFASASVRKVDTIYRTAGTDSIIYTINGLRRAFKDSTGGGGWSTTGNSGTVFGTNYIGTSDNVGIQFKTNGTVRMFITSAGVIAAGANTYSTSYFYAEGNSTGNPATGYSFEGFGAFKSNATQKYAYVHNYFGNTATFGCNSSGQLVIASGSPGGTTDVITINNGYSAGGNVGIGASPVASAKLLVSSTTSGFLPPVMTTTQRDAISSPATGLMIFCSDCTATDASTGVTQTYNGSTWKNFW